MVAYCRSFVITTTWRGYVGETAMSDVSQLVGLMEKGRDSDTSGPHRDRSP